MLIGKQQILTVLIFVELKQARDIMDRLVQNSWRSDDV